MNESANDTELDQSVNQSINVTDDENMECTTANFHEDGNYVEMEATGQATEFVSEEETEDSESENEQEQDEENFRDEENMETTDKEENYDSDSQCSQNRNRNASANIVGHYRYRKEGASHGSKFDEVSDVEIVFREESMWEPAGEMSDREMQQFAPYMKKEGLMMVKASDNRKEKQGKFSREKRIQGNVTPPRDLDRRSEITIYRNAVEPESKRDSSSSDEPLDTSDEVDKLPIQEMDPSSRGPTDLVHQFIVENPLETAARKDRVDMVRRNLIYTGEAGHQPQPHSSHMAEPQGERTPQRIPRGEEMLHAAEGRKAQMYGVKGKEDLSLLQRIDSASLDDDYLVVGAHIDASIRKKISEGEYIDFARLIPKDRVASEEDTRMEMVNRNGLSFWVPLADRESASITGFSKWEQAFRIFSNIYTEFFPEKAGQLIQYNHVIYTASQSYIWENVYHYDREFRMHVSRHHPHRGWVSILQQAWSMYLKDRVGTPGHTRSAGKNRSNTVRRRLCLDFNKGNCTFGQKCKFEHRCSFCNKYGHRLFNCRKVGRGSTGSGGGNNGHNAKGGNGNGSGRKDGDRWNKYEKEQQKLNNQVS